MIYVYTGRNGSGKTFHMVKVAYSQWLRGRDIFSNTPLLFAKVKFHGRPNILSHPEIFTLTERILWHTIKFFNKNLRVKERGRIVYFSHISEIIDAEDGLILFDEAQVLFNSRNWASLPDEFQYKLQQHRKHNLDLYCTTQNVKRIDIIYRELIHVWMDHTAVFQLGQRPCNLGFFRVEVKDVEQMISSPDEVLVSTLSSFVLTIHRFSPRLYNTMYDIGFKRFKIVWLSYFDGKGTAKKRWMIIPKKMSPQDAKKAISFSKSVFGMSKFPSFRTR